MLPVSNPLKGFKLLKADWSADYLTCRDELGLVEEAPLWSLGRTIVSGNAAHSHQHTHTKQGLLAVCAFCCGRICVVLV